MITHSDLQAAIAECQGERNPNANTCIKLAAFYIIKDHLYGEHDEPEPPAYSFAAPRVETTAETHVAYDSGTEFANTIRGMKADDAWAVIDELMDVLALTQPRLYRGTIAQLRDAQNR